MDLTFTAEVWYWRGPSPYHFVTVPEHHADALGEVAGRVSDGWGVIPAAVRVGDTTWTTSLIPKNGGYLVPIKDKVRRAEGIEVGDRVTLALTVAADG